MRKKTFIYFQMLIYKHIMHLCICVFLFSTLYGFMLKAETNECLSTNNKLALNVVPQQDAPIKGKVVDEDGNPIIGATIQLKGSSNMGTVTDADGNFTLTNVPTNGILVFSYVGYKTYEENINNQSSINVTLIEDVQAMDEVVVVGYGITKRRDLVGAVESLNGDIIKERGNMNISRSLQGMIPGVNITMKDGKPSRTATLDIRGTSSVGAGGNPLILIDGVDAHGDLTTVNPADVENISVLKDASSAAIYGARGAFGVILITTKNGSKGKPQFNYTGSLSAHQRLNEPQIVTNGLQWTNGFLSAYQGAKNSTPAGINNVFKFNQSWYDELKKRDADPTLEKVRVNDNGLYEYFGNTNWFDVLYKDYNTSTEHNLSLSGGSDKVSCYLSGRYFNQTGIYNEPVKEYYNQYNFRAKGEIKLNEYITLNNNTDILRRIVHQPMVMYDRQNILRQLEHQGYPMTMPKNLDGTWTEAGVYTGWAGFVEGTSFQKNKKLDVKNTTTLTYKPIESLIFKTDYSYYINHSERVRAEDQYTYYKGPEVTGARNTYSSLEHWSYDNEYMSSNATANYIPKLSNSDHYLNVLGGVNFERRTSTNLQTYRRGLMYSQKPTFALTDGDYYTVNQTGYEWSYLGFLFRTNYNLKNRYLFEVSGRYDGSSKFPVNQKWGLFPSMSFGWRLSDEPFMSSTKKWLDNLKLRISAGSLGNGNVTPYLYLQLMNIGRTSTIIDGTLQTYASAPNNIPDNLTWETSTTYDVGLDADLFNNRLNFVFDWYRRFTADMFTVGPELPAVYGASAPKGNYADMKTHGWEISLQWRDQFQLYGYPFNYSIKGMLWDNRSWITKYNNPNKNLNSYYEGMEIGEIWGYHVEGLFRDQAEIDAHADQSGIRISDAGVWQPGDIKFADIDASHRIDNGANTLDDSGDRRIIGNSSERYNFGINLTSGWNGIGLNAFFQGVGKKNWYPHRESAFFWGQYNRPYSYMLQMHTGNNVWTEENQNFDAYWPRYRGYIASTSSGVLAMSPNDRYLQNVAYIRLKSLQIDYTFKKGLIRNLKIEALRVYLSGDNLWTWSPLFKVTQNFDPENINPGDTDFRSSANRDGDGYSYPMMRTYSIGLNVTF